MKKDFDYKNLVLAFADDDGKIFAKGVMKKEEVDQLKKLHKLDEKEIMSLLFNAIIEDYKTKLAEDDEEYIEN